MSATLHVFQCRLHEPCARVWICMHSVMVISIEGLFLNGLRIAQRSAAPAALKWLKTEKLAVGKTVHYTERSFHSSPWASFRLV